MMNITRENIIWLILNSKSRGDLLKAIALETDKSLDISKVMLFQMLSII